LALHCSRNFWISIDENLDATSAELIDLIVKFDVRYFSPHFRMK